MMPLTENIQKGTKASYAVFLCPLNYYYIIILLLYYIIILLFVNFALFYVLVLFFKLFPVKNVHCLIRTFRNFRQRTKSCGEILMLAIFILFKNSLYF